MERGGHAEGAALVIALVVGAPPWHGDRIAFMANPRSAFAALKAEG